MVKQRVVFESRAGKAKRASSPAVTQFTVLIDNPPADLEQQIKRLNSSELAALVTALILEVANRGGTDGRHSI